MQPHFVVFAFPFGSHSATVLTLVAKLAAAAPASAFSFFTTAWARASIPGSLLSSCEQLPNLGLHDLPEVGMVTEGFAPQRGREEAVEMFLDAASDLCRWAVEGLTLMPAASCVVSDLFMACASEMAEEMSLPWVGIWISAGVALLAHYYTDSIRRTLGVKEDEIQAKEAGHIDFIPCMSDVVVADLPEGIIVGNLDSTFPQMLRLMGQAWVRADAVVLNSFEGLESAIMDHMRTVSNKLVLPLGPLSLLAPPPSKADAHGCLPWLNKIGQLGSVVYVAFSTMSSPPPVELAALAEGLEESGIHFMWSLKEEERGKLPLGFLERTRDKGLVVPWAPQPMVLAHAAVGAFITHCGWNSVLESINGGVPMIFRPLFGDQRINGRMVSDVWAIGIGFDGGTITKEGVVRACDLVLNKEEGKKMRENVRALKEIALKAMSEDGSSRKSFEVLLEVVSKGKE